MLTKSNVVAVETEGSGDDVVVVVVVVVSLWSLLLCCLRLCWVAYALSHPPFSQT